MSLPGPFSSTRLSPDVFHNSQTIAPQQTVKQAIYHKDVPHLHDVDESPSFLSGIDETRETGEMCYDWEVMSKREACIPWSSMDHPLLH
jgi:hypothetical protein